ncbi:MAG: hypothetical protein H6R19_838 [Proteobacteria bacterium]|nr:hypothetical protein [Pseudomonadota bacterium]
MITLLSFPFSNHTVTMRAGMFSKALGTTNQHREKGSGTDCLKRVRAGQWPALTIFHVGVVYRFRAGYACG